MCMCVCVASECKCAWLVACMFIRINLNGILGIFLTWTPDHWYKCIACTWGQLSDTPDRAEWHRHKFLQHMISCSYLTVLSEYLKLIRVIPRIPSEVESFEMTSKAREVTTTQSQVVTDRLPYHPRPILHCMSQDQKQDYPLRWPKGCQHRRRRNDEMDVSWTKCTLAGWNGRQQDEIDVSTTKLASARRDVMQLAMCLVLMGTCINSL